jgi:glycosyltransferase involved in cell wall biosynthesis
MHKLPVVGSRLGGILDLVHDGVNGLTYEAFSPEALALALQRFLDEPGLAESLASRAPAVKTIAEDAHEWEARYETRLSARVPVSA